MHGAALPLGIAAPPAGQFRHDALRIHAADEHVAVIAIGCDDLIAFPDRHLHADDDRLLADIEVTETADLPHAVELTRLLLKAANEEHLPVGAQLFLFAQFGGSLFIGLL